MPTLPGFKGIKGSLLPESVLCMRISLMFSISLLYYAEAPMGILHAGNQVACGGFIADSLLGRQGFEGANCIASHPLFPAGKSQVLRGSGFYIDLLHTDP
ncbi:hypothetical protein SDC9_181203 [bioreactor metagenome]|uniref:Uncharacterized protein n=1 Tax=bioreactor metagenome TaxID=1076179 RepID=A0A645H5U0_9ZZZZ